LYLQEPYSTKLLHTSFRADLLRIKIPRTFSYLFPAKIQTRSSSVANDLLEPDFGLTDFFGYSFFTNYLPVTTSLSSKKLRQIRTPTWAKVVARKDLSICLKQVIVYQTSVVVASSREILTRSFSYELRKAFNELGYSNKSLTLFDRGILTLSLRENSSTSGIQETIRNLGAPTSSQVEIRFGLKLHKETFPVSSYTECTSL